MLAPARLMIGGSHTQKSRDYESNYEKISFSHKKMIAVVYTNQGPMTRKKG